MSAPMADVGMARLGDVWVYLAASPLLGLTLTLLAYGLAHRIFTACGAHPLANPVALAVALIGTLLWLTGTPYATYFEGAQFVHFLLGPATVALAVALHAHAPLLRRLWAPSRDWPWAWPPCSTPWCCPGCWAPSCSGCAARRDARAARTPPAAGDQPCKSSRRAISNRRSSSCG